MNPPGMERTNNNMRKMNLDRLGANAALGNDTRPADNTPLHTLPSAPHALPDGQTTIPAGRRPFAWPQEIFAEQQEDLRKSSVHIMHFMRRTIAMRRDVLTAAP